MALEYAVGDRVEYWLKREQVWAPGTILSVRRNDPRVHRNQGGIEFTILIKLDIGPIIPVSRLTASGGKASKWRKLDKAMEGM